MRDLATKAIKIIAPLLVSCFLLTVLASRLDVHHTVETIRSVDLKHLLLAVFFVTLYFATSGVRFSWLAKPVLNITYLHSIALNFFVVLSAHGFGILSDALRVAYVHKKHRISLKTSVALNFADRLLSLWLLGISLLVLTPLFLPSPWGISLFLTGIVGVWLTYKILRFSFWPSWIKQIFEIFYDGVNSIRSFLNQFLLAYFGVGLIAVALCVLAHAMHLTFYFWTILALSPIVLFASIIPFTYAGLGTREAAFVFFAPLLTTMQHEQALALSLMLGVCFLLSSLVGGVIALLIAGKSVWAASSNMQQTPEIT